MNPQHELQNDTPMIHPQDNYSYAETIEQRTLIAIRKGDWND